MTIKSARVQQLFSQTRTVCIGRLLLDVPAESAVVYGPSYAPWPLTTYIGDAEKKESVVAKRLAETLEERNIASGNLRGEDSLVGTLREGGFAGQKIVFGITKGNSAIYKIDSYVAAGENLFVQTADPIAAEKDKAIQDLNAIASALRYRELTEIPTEAGACVDGGFIAETPYLRFEAFNLGVRLQAFPDVHFSLSATNKDVLVESDALEPRLRQAEEIANHSGQGGWYSRIKTFRRGRRQIGHWHGFEMLAWKPAQETEGESHEFVYVSQGEPKNALRPLLELELHTGVLDNRVGNAKPSLTDEEAVELWDRLTASIRVRPYK
ncbi:T6SS immunity protein Tli4 family protein [Duganella callida]|uniref:Tle cognate immunity protein 4 C-terminal domain-containing protein n=1 Tax=Duganella callida TaxID=2561932 RepID=A0A4Y9RYK4_9BURK|nr:T6SS immunity protein Tli4 family protein [Duganella callida]TFW13301.1 hypothetical protein E4L98_29310 [Duganella callida]